jgi:CHASE1-domain containing sensor protein
LKTSLRSRSVRLIALACGLVATVFAWYTVGEQADQEARAQFASRTNLATGVLERRIQRYLDILYGLQAFAYHSEDFTRQGFRQYVTALQLGKRFPGVQAVEFVRRVPLAGRSALELRAEVFNLTNTPPFGAPNTTAGAAAFGTITSAGDPRVVQLAVKFIF